MVASELTKGSRVEVSSDDVGFKDAWYVATVVDVVQSSPKKKGSNNKNKSKKKIGYLVKYDSLFKEEDLSLPLTEVVDASFVRPLPPRYPRRNNDNNEAEEAEEDGGVDFELYDVVDAYHLDGWWSGVVTKVIVDGEIRKYLVSFQSPPEEFEFERSDLRLHVDWIDFRWRFPARKTLEQISKSNNDVTPSIGSLTTNRSGNPRSSAKKKIYSRKRPRTDSMDSGNEDIMDSVEENSRTKRLQPSRDKKGNTEDMESIKGSSRSQVIHQDSLLLEQETIITTPEHALTDKNATQTPSKRALMTDRSGYKRSSTKKKNHSQKKPKTNSRNKDNMDSVEENLRAKRFQPSRDKKGNTQDTESPRGSSGSQAMHQDSLLSEQEMIITESGGAEDGNSQQKRKRGRPPKTPVKTPNALLQGNEEARERDSSAIDETPSEIDEQPLSMWYQGRHPLMVSKNSRVSNFSALDHPNEPNNIPNPETHQNHQELPFTKSSPIWATLESSKLYQNPPQNPHFSPLIKVKEDHREGLAIGHMVTFANVVQKTSRLQLTDPNDIINSSLDTLVDLESHGFNVGVVRARLNELLARKVSLGQLDEESKVVKSELMKVNLEKSVMEGEISEIVGKMKELQEKLAQAVTRKHTKHEEIVILKSKLRVIYDQIADVKVDFENIVVSPL